MKPRRFKTDNENIEWRDTGHIKVYNYPPDSTRTFSYITRVYQQYEKNNINVIEVEGSPIYFRDLTLEEQSLAIILATAQNTLLSLLKRDEFLTEVK